MEDEKLQRAEVFVHVGGRHCGTKWTITNRRIFLLLPLPPPHIKHERVVGALLGRREEESHGDGVFVTTIFFLFRSLRRARARMDSGTCFVLCICCCCNNRSRREPCELRHTGQGGFLCAKFPISGSETFLCNVHTLVTIRFRKLAWLEPFSPSESLIP